MNCGVRFCGGCNPRYDRGAALAKLKEEEPEVNFQIAEEGVDYDYLLVIGGCTNCCASHCQFSTKQGLVKMWDEQHLDKVIENINNAASNLKKD